MEIIMNKKQLGIYLFVGAAFISFLFSVSLWFSGYREEGLFVGLWVPSILGLGCLLLAGKGVVR
jgi:hypothetical protein